MIFFFLSAIIPWKNRVFPYIERSHRTSMKKLVIFDLDGTLNVTALYSIPAQRKAIREFGGPEYSNQVLQSCLGRRPIDYAREFLPGRSEEDYQLYLQRELYWESIFMPMHHDSFPGIPQALQQLRDNGYQTAVCSNSSIQYITMKLKNLGLWELIDHIQPLLPGMTKVDTLGKLLAEQSPCQGVMVGDRIYDKEAARQNHIPFIGCLYGYCPEEMEGADGVIQSGDELLSEVQRLIG